MDQNKNKFIEQAAEQWVNIILAHLQHKKRQRINKKYKNNYGK